MSENNNIVSPYFDFLETEYGFRIVSEKVMRYFDNVVVDLQKDALIVRLYRDRGELSVSIGPIADVESILTGDADSSKTKHNRQTAPKATAIVGPVEMIGDNLQSLDMVRVLVLNADPKEDVGIPQLAAFLREHFREVVDLFSENHVMETKRKLKQIEGKRQRFLESILFPGWNK